MQNEDDSISGVKPQSIIKALQPSLLQLGVIGQMRFTVKRISMEELCFTVIFRYVNKFKWLDQVQSSQ